MRASGKISALSWLRAGEAVCVRSCSNASQDPRLQLFPYSSNITLLHLFRSNTQHTQPPTLWPTRQTRPYSFGVGRLPWFSPTAALSLSDSSI